MKKYTRNEVLMLMRKSFIEGYKKHDVVEAGLEGLEEDVECAWILMKYDTELNKEEVYIDKTQQAAAGKARVYRSPVLDRLMREMEKDPWHVKLRRWWRVKLWTWICLTRKYWDKEYQNYIFKRKNN